MDVKEDVNIDEARTKDPSKLAKEIKKIKKIIKDKQRWSVQVRSCVTN